MEQPKTQEEKKEEMKKAYDTVVSKHEEYKEIWKSFLVTPEGEQEKKAFSIRTGYSPSQRPKTPAMKAFEELRGIWTVYGEWPDSIEEKPSCYHLTGLNGPSMLQYLMARHGQRLNPSLQPTLGGRLNTHKTLLDLVTLPLSVEL